MSDTCENHASSINTEGYEDEMLEIALTWSHSNAGERVALCFNSSEITQEVLSAEKQFVNIYIFSL